MGEFRGLPAAGLAYLAATLVVMGSAPATAQTSFEFGYKDRIFKQNYELPPADATSQLWAFRELQVRRAFSNPNFLSASTNSEAKHILKGTCASDYLATFSGVGPTTSERRAVLALPDVEVRPDPPDLHSCSMQLYAFYSAFSDPASTDAQLEWLAGRMRQRFSNDWISDGEMSNPQIEKAAQELAVLSLRERILSGKGIPLPEALAQRLKLGTVRSRIVSLTDPAISTDVESQLSAIEREAPAIARGRIEQEAVKKKEEQKAAYIQDLIERADRAVLVAGRQLESSRAAYESNLERARLNPSAARTAELQAKELLDEIGRKEQDLKQAVADREKLKAHLAKVANGTPAAPQQSQPQAPSRDPSTCYIGERCSILSKTIFCETLGQMQAVLSKPAGPQRRKLLHDLMARRACLVLEAGTLLYPHGDVLTVRPIGEAPADAAAARLEGGREGFVLGSAVGSDQTASR